MKNINKQKGNVLFLILIAVALFAALSYAVTQSSRSSGDPGRETNILNSAQLTQYPNQVRTAVLRMLIDGRGIESLEFNAPADFNNLTSENVGVFHPNGGGAVFQNAPLDVMDPDDGNAAGQWFYNLEAEVPLIGTDQDSDRAGNDLIAFLPGVSTPVCEQINDKVGIDNIPTLAAAPGTAITANMDHAYTLPTDEVDIASGTVLDGQPFACFQHTGVNTYYHVISER